MVERFPSRWKPKRNVFENHAQTTVEKREDGAAMSRAWELQMS